MTAEVSTEGGTSMISKIKSRLHHCIGCGLRDVYDSRDISAIPSNNTWTLVGGIRWLSRVLFLNATTESPGILFEPILT